MLQESLDFLRQFLPDTSELTQMRKRLSNGSILNQMRTRASLRGNVHHVASTQPINTYYNRPIRHNGPNVSPLDPAAASVSSRSHILSPGVLCLVFSKFPRKPFTGGRREEERWRVLETGRFVRYVTRS